VRYLKRQLIFAVILAAAIVLGACSGGSDNVIASAAFDKEILGSQDTTALTVQIANSEGKTQVNDTEVLKVMVTAADGQFTVEPVAGSAETLSQENELEVSLKPGAVLPRDFHFNISANGAAAGEYTFTVTLNKGEDSEVYQDVTLAVE
jgi:galactose mutarotase-like enzyme